MDRHVAVVEQDLGALVAEGGGLCHAHRLDVGVLHRDVGILQGGDHRAVAGEVAHVLAVGLGVKGQLGVPDGMLAAHGHHSGEVVGGGADLDAVHGLSGDGAALDRGFDGVGLVHTLGINHHGGPIGLNAPLAKAAGLLGHG